MKFTRADFRKASPKYKLVGHLEKALAEFDDAWSYSYEPKRGDLGWHPSGDCTPPPSILYESALDRLNKTVPPSRFSNKNGQVGHFWHQYLQHVLVHKLGFADAEAIERRGHKWWGDHIKPDGVDHWPEGEPYWGIGKEYYRKEDLYYQRYPEQRDGRITDETIATWPDFPPEVKNCKIRPKVFHYSTGTADVAPCVIPHHGEYVVDFKTMASNQYRQLTVPAWAAKKYECQINIYMDFFGLEKGLIVAVNKDSPHELKEFEYRRDDALVEAIYDKWKFVSECLERENPPGEAADASFILPLEEL